VAHVINTVRKVAAAEGTGTQEDTWLFDTLFLDNVEKHGRLNEMEVMVRYKLAKKNLFDMNDAGMGFRMFLKGRMGLKPHNIRERAALKTMLRKLKSQKGPV
jgi:heterodisulfide reductase subunit C